MTPGPKTVTQETVPILGRVALEARRVAAPTGPVEVTPVPVGPPPAPAGFALGEVVGSGGMGVVYLAQDLSLGRDVAVKVMGERWVGDADALARFVGEARITGQLQHPGVPAVYQTGTISPGHPYLAMKLVRGETLQALLGKPGAINPLAVFEAICHAVGYAHSRGVIHRDLKPANVMVGGFGEVQVMDWGLAKVRGESESARGGAVAGSAGPGATPTVAGSVLGTPEYMPPEQADGRADRADSRSDVFGLGAILCALLTGRPPFEGVDSESVREASARGDTAAALSRLAGCGADPGVLALCRRCLSIDPAGRPPDGEAVASELAGLRAAAEERARSAELDFARAEVRVAEESKRRRAGIRAAVAVVAVSLLGVAASGAGLVFAKLSERGAEAARADAVQKQEAADASAAARQVSEARAVAALAFVTDDVMAAPRPQGQDGGQGVDTTLRQALDAAAGKLEERFRDDPLTEATIRTALGTSYLRIGRHEQARGEYAHALELGEGRLAPDHPDTLARTDHVAEALSALGLHADAARIHERMLADYRVRLGPDDPATLASAQNLAANYMGLGRHDEAIALAEVALERMVATLGPNHPGTLDATYNLAMSYLELERPEPALACARRALEGMTERFGADHPGTLDAISVVANCYSDLGRHAEAVALVEKLVARRATKLGPGHPDTVSGLLSLGETYLAAGRAADALPLLEDSARRMAVGRLKSHRDVYLAAHHLAGCYSTLGRDADATAAVDAYLKLVERVEGIDPKWVLDLLDIRVRHPLASGDAAGCRRAAELCEALCPGDPATQYAQARYWALAARLSGEKADADRAMARLAKAVTAGYAADLAGDDDLAVLRARADFRGLLKTAPGPGAAK